MMGENFENKNKRLNRPLSPHLSIYKFQANMALSISHRITGLAQNGMLYGLALGNWIEVNKLSRAEIRNWFLNRCHGVTW